ncbi:MAG: hypothetical protein AUH42_02185, partial [Gemmatimonadetes bacterium 13_1_40CM_70_11]
MLLLLAWLVAYPILIVAGEAAHVDALRAFVSRPGEWAALWASLWISLASVALAALIGVPLAFLFEWFEFPGRKALGALIALPAVLPPFVGVIAFLFLYGESGFISRALQHAFGLAQAPWRLQGAGAILLVHAYSMYVYFYLFTRAGLARLDQSMLEAAQALRAGRGRLFRRVVLPLLRPALTGAALLTFMTALGSFSAPYVFGGGFRVMTTQIYSTKVNGDLALAMVETLALALVAVGGLVLLRHTQGEDLLVALGKGTAPRRRPIRRPAVRALATAAGWLFAVLLLLPHLTLLLVSLVPYATWTTETLPPVLSLVNYRRVFSEPERLRPLFNSFWMASVSTAAVVVVALAAGWLVVRRRVAVRRWIESFLELPWALPGTVFAVALATTFGVSKPFALRHPRGLPPARPGARGGGGEPGRWPLGHAAARHAAAPRARARRGGEPRVRRGAGRLCVLHRALYIRHPAHRHRDHVQSAPERDGRGRGVRRGAHGVQRRRPLDRSPPVKRLSVLMAVCFVDMLGLMLVAPLMAFYALRLQAPEWLVGPLIASFAVAQLISSPVWGKLSDRYGRRPALLVGLGASAFAYLIFGFANSLWLLFASRIVQGMGGGTTGVAQAYVADTMQPTERAKALGWLSAATSAGVVIGPFIGSVAHRFGTEVPGLVAAALVLINVGFAWGWLPESRVPHAHTTTPSGRYVPLPGGG